MSQVTRKQVLDILDRLQTRCRIARKTEDWELLEEHAIHVRADRIYSANTPWIYILVNPARDIALSGTVKASFAKRAAEIINERSQG